MKRSTALVKAQQKFNKKLYKYQVKLNPDKYPEEIAFIESIENKNQFLIELIQKEIKNSLRN